MKEDLEAALKDVRRICNEYESSSNRLVQIVYDELKNHLPCIDYDCSYRVDDGALNVFVVFKSSPTFSLSVLNDIQKALSAIEIHISDNGALLGNGFPYLVIQFPLTGPF